MLGNVKSAYLHAIARRSRYTHETPPTAPARGPLVMAGMDMEAEEVEPLPAPPVAVARTVVAWVPEGQVVTAAVSVTISDRSGATRAWERPYLSSTRNRRR